MQPLRIENYFFKPFFVLISANPHINIYVRQRQCRTGKFNLCIYLRIKERLAASLDSIPWPKMLCI